MQQHESLDSDMDGVVRENLNSEIPPEVERRLKGRLDGFRDALAARDARRAVGWRRAFTAHPFAWAGGSAGLAAAAVLIVAFVSAQSPGALLYGQVMRALEGVRTVHMSGWTTNPHLFYPVDVNKPDAVQRYEIDSWEWTGEDGRRKSYLHKGRLTILDEGLRRYRHDALEDRLSIGKSGGSPTGEIFTIAESLKDFQKRGFEKEELGTRTRDQVTLEGVRLERARDNRLELWLKAGTSLPVSISHFEWDGGAWVQVTELAIAYDEPVPAQVSGYAPPDAKQTFLDSDIDPLFDEYRLRLRRLAARYRSVPLPEKMEIVERDSEKKFQALIYGHMPGIDGYGVWPLGTLDGKLGSFLYPGNWVPVGALRVPKEVREIPACFDLVVKSGTSIREQKEFVLEHLGLEMVETAEARTVWVAHYDGRTLKSWREVKAPVRRRDRRPLAPGMASGASRLTIRDLFNDFVWWQDIDLTARGIMIIDETGLPEEDGDSRPVYVSSESPFWGGEVSIEMAQRWFEEQFGVTFTEEKREMTVYVVRRKAADSE